MSASRATRQATLLAALAPISWGSTYLVTTELLPPDRPFFTGVARALPAGLLLLAVTRTLPRGAWWWRAPLLGALNIGVFFATLFIAAYRLPGGVAAVAGAAAPLVVMLLSTVLLGQRLRLRPALLGVAALGGIALVVLRATARLDAVGVAAALAGTVSMALATVLAKRWGPPADAGALALTGWQLTAGGLLLLPVAAWTEGAPPALTAVNLAGYAYLALLNTALAYWLWFRGIAALGAVPLSFLGLLSPLTAATLGWLLLGQTLTGWQLLGGAVALLGTVLAQLPAARRNPPPPPTQPAPRPPIPAHARTAA
ncbi:EamA family transporter [Allostreptomyces psammosilenae]|uniref:Putative blue pigment (Indigoidine) exporter n=1 Tax=Allostreptomyces psammosilenae TaxID=1892865 RepID=A0A852ZSI7_9ACTN|nr:EamA family transporter [Allostreptomyces psammosilenae]NYI05396.1 putative blue pigment (indigoidine) exporter [Allostreptomyces psammosilenae]